MLILVEGRSRMILEQKANAWLAVVSDWCERVGLEVSSSKSACMNLKGRFSNSRPPIVKYRGRNLPYSKEIK